jgi:DNA mismatch endonuclease (patch repair protein)
MADIFDRKKRSEVMSLVRSSNNVSTELRLMGLFRKHGVTGWRRGLKLPGRPDFTFPKERLCVFVDGCFWHGCPRCYRKPKSNARFWAQKVQRNRQRDRQVSRKLRGMGVAVYRVWECRIGEGMTVTRIRVAVEGRRGKP